jgi:repressor LexA
MGRKRKLTLDEALEILNRWRVEHGVSPTVEEFRRAAKLGSVRTAFRYLELLEEEGYIERRSGARGVSPLKVPNLGTQTRTVPIVGTAPAGPLMVAEENHQGWVKLPKEFFRSPQSTYFLLRVKGDSMNKCSIGPDKIEDGDLVLIRQQPSCREGEVVVALVDGEATIKRLRQGPGYFALKPESSNPENKPIVVQGDFRIQGVVCRVLKKGFEILTE